MDLHAAQIQGYFDIPVDHLFGMPVLAKFFRKIQLEDLVVVSPDLGSVTRARTMAQSLDAPIAIIDKRRQKANESEIMHVIGDIEGKNCILVGDMIDTAGTIANAANKLTALGAKEVYACATHGVLSGPAIERIEKSSIKEMVLLNTIPLPADKRSGKIRVLSVASLFAEAMGNIYNNNSVSKMFDA
jgi:ribose-phosphate pyrophosphokinase